MKLEEFLNQNKKTYLIFDFDRTLFKLLIPWEKWIDSIKNQLQQIDTSIMDDYTKGKITLSELENRYIETYPQTKDLIINHALSFEKNNLHDVKPNKNLVSFIRTHTQYAYYIWSSNTPPTIEPILSKNNMLHYFKKIVTRLDVTFIKPHPEGFIKIYNATIPKNQYLFLGDSTDDANAAKEADIDFFPISYFDTIKTTI